MEKVEKVYKKTVFERINDVMKEMGGIAKNRRNEAQKYNFRGIDDAMEAFKPLFTKHGLFPAIVKIEDVASDEVVSRAETKGYHQIKRMTVRFYSVDGTYVDVMSDGEAIDYGDKASNKAMSVGYREALFKTFIVPFGNDDIENHDHDLSSSKPVAKKLSIKQKEMILRQLDMLTTDQEVYEKRIGKKIDEMTMSEASDCIAALIKRVEEQKKPADGDVDINTIVA